MVSESSGVRDSCFQWETFQEKKGRNPTEPSWKKLNSDPVFYVPEQ